jgi:hypothetical protein
MSATNPATGEVITVDGYDGDVAMRLADGWVKVFHFFEGRVSFKAGVVRVDDPKDPILQTAFALARLLRAKIVGDEGEEYTSPVPKKR